MAKASKEAKITETPVEQVVKKSRSGKRKPKEPAVEIIAEVNVSSISNTWAEGKAEEIAKEVDAKIVADLVAEVKTLDPKKELTPQAYQWMLYLQRNQMTPDQWLARYSTNKFKHHVEEIVRFLAQK